MARMIPPECPRDAPAGEAMLFQRLKDDPGTEGWVVLHSLVLRKHRSKAEGEVDMVVLVPNHGILCLEVKGCTVSRKDGLWIYPYDTSVEGPFRQSSGAMHALRNFLGQRDAALGTLLYISAVAFTRIDFDEESPEWDRWQVINSSMLRRMPVSHIVERILKKAHERAGALPVNRGWYDAQKSRPDAATVKRIASALRSNFEYVVPPQVDVQRVESSLRRLTEEQYDALDSIDGNCRVVMRGLAGTGKTFLALEAARRAASRGESVLLICFNRLLSAWLRCEIAAFPEDIGRNIRCRHLHGLFREIAGPSVQVQDHSFFWTQELPAIVIDRLLDEGDKHPGFDILLIDEAQDVIADPYLDTMDLLLKGGLAAGKWVFFGDFDNQAIYAKSNESMPLSMLEMIRSRAPDCAQFTLRVNCRNAAPIAETLVLACNVSPGYSRYLQEMEGAVVDPHFWKSGDDQMALLRRVIEGQRRRFSADEIVVLSMKNDDTSCAGKMADSGITMAPLREGAEAHHEHVRFGSIHAFKGLEAAAVIVTDIDHLDANAKTLLYVGMSRARVHLSLLMKESCRSSYDKMLTIGLRRRS